MSTAVVTGSDAPPVLELARWSEAIAEAVGVRILASAPVEDGGEWPTAFLPGPAAKGCSPAAIAAMLPPPG